jgi:DNA-binding Lrp family transcriptional regulator
MAYIEWWNRTGPSTLGERFGLNEISTRAKTLSPTKSYVDGGRIGFQGGLLAKGIELTPAAVKGVKYIKDLLTKRPVITGVERTQPKTDYSWDQLFTKKFKEFADTHFAGNWTEASKSLGVTREKIKSIFQGLAPGKRSYGEIATGGKTIPTLEIQSGAKSFKDITTDLKYSPEILTERIKKLVKQGKVSEKNFYNSKDLANILGMDSTTKRNIDSLTTLLKQKDVLFQNISPTIKKYNLGDASKKIRDWSSTKLVKGDAAASTERLKIEADWDQPLVRFFDNLKNQTRSLSKDADIYVRNAVEDIGHAQSVKVITKYPNLFKNSNVRSMQTLTYQDPQINQQIFQNQGFQGRYEGIFKELNKFVNKKVTKDTIGELNSLRKQLKNNYTSLVKRIKQEAKKNPYFIGQEKRIPELKLADLKIGDTFKSENIFADMSTVDSSYIVGEIFKINPTAKKFKDLTSKQKEWYKQSVTNQTLNNLEKFYTKVGYRSGEIEELKEALLIGTASKKGLAQGGRPGFDAGTLVAEEVQVKPNKAWELAKKAGKYGIVKPLAGITLPGTHIIPETVKAVKEERLPDYDLTNPNTWMHAAFWNWAVKEWGFDKTVKNFGESLKNLSTGDKARVFRNVVARAGLSPKAIQFISSRVAWPLTGIMSVHDAYEDYQERKEFLTPERIAEAQEEEFDKEEPMFAMGGIASLIK